jgi:carboxypeptidase C (cathepsin A)
LVNAGVDLAHALTQDPNLRVLVLAGYFDLASSFSEAEYTVSHLNLPSGVSSRIKMEYYEAGHLIYVQPASLEKMKRDLGAFIDSTAHP